MKICPNSNSEYDGDNCECPKCISLEKDIEGIQKKGWTTLTTVSNDIEFELVAGLLAMGEIPVVRQVEGVDGYLQIVLGIPIGGIHVMVPNDKYEEAFQLINAQVDENVLEEEEEKTEDAVEKEE